MKRGVTPRNPNLDVLRQMPRRDHTLSQKIGVPRRVSRRARHRHTERDLPRNRGIAGGPTLHNHAAGAREIGAEMAIHQYASPITKHVCLLDTFRH